MKFTLKEVQNNIKSVLKKEKSSIKDLKIIFSLIDLTTLKPTDNKTVIQKMCTSVNTLAQKHSDISNVAAICVYPSMVENVKKNLLVNTVRIASVAAGFPASQTFLSVKAAESELAVSKGANDIDIVISLGKFLEGDFEAVAQEIRIIKNAIGDAHLKVILETGLMEKLDDIYKASLIAIQSGADFIKTSTGKEEPAASLEAVYVMCHTIKKHYEETGKKIGIKPAGGIATSKEAFSYYAIVRSILGEQWLNSKYFRIGASRLANNLLNDIYKNNQTYF